MDTSSASTSDGLSPILSLLAHQNKRESQDQTNYQNVNQAIEALKNPQKNVHTISLFNTNMTDDDLERLSRALIDNATLTYLDLGRNDITYDGLKTLVPVLKRNVTLRCLLLFENPIDNRCIDLIEDILKSNFTLNWISFNFCQINHTGVERVTALVKKTPFLYSFSLFGNIMDDKLNNKLACAENDNRERLVDTYTKQSLYTIRDIFHLYNGRTIISSETNKCKKEITAELATAIRHCKFELISTLVVVAIIFLKLSVVFIIITLTIVLIPKLFFSILKCFDCLDLQYHDNNNDKDVNTKIK
eukprot:Awhi_evm1s864